jgi:hypothetical protein
MLPINPNQGLITPAMTRPTPIMAATKTAASAMSRRVRDAGMVNTTTEPMANPTQPSTNSHVFAASPMQRSFGNNAHDRQAITQAITSGGVQALNMQKNGRFVQEGIRD